MEDDLRLKAWELARQDDDTHGARRETDGGAALIDGQVAELLQAYPELRGPKSKATGSAFRLGRIVAIWNMNFLCRAFGRPDLGYMKQGRARTA